MLLIRKTQRLIALLLRIERVHGSLLPHHLTERQAPLKGKAPLVRFDGVVKTER